VTVYCPSGVRAVCVVDVVACTGRDVRRPAWLANASCSTRPCTLGGNGWPSSDRMVGIRSTLALGTSLVMPRAKSGPATISVLWTS
jgi:hypothetical protein